MLDRVRIIIAGCLYYSGLVKLARWWTMRAGRCLVILNYHRASGGDLRRQWLYLRRHYRVLPLENALEELYAPRNKGIQRKDRRPLLALTFDDGYYDSYTHAFALACELHVPITIFLIPGYIESAHCFWWLEGEHLTRNAQVDKVAVEGRIYHLNKPEERKALAQAIYIRARYASSVTDREAFLTSICSALATTSFVTVEEELALPLTWETVRKMAGSAWISFGAHTMNHPVLAYLTEPAEMQFEVEECRAALERQLGHPVRTFAYPLGKPEHIGDHALRTVRQTGYDWAVTTIRGFNTARSDPYLLRRLGVGADEHWLPLAAQVAGIWDYFSSISHRFHIKRGEG
jgi:peptidoglycan/xylan/chitin deacetylase (PgdA/CDA1 family)